jgi:ectoine hydroxylase-related dioxygenase (phytanoyl-CoA dioxygenase family)
MFEILHGRHWDDTAPTRRDPAIDRTNGGFMMTTADSTVVLSGEEIAFYHREGYLVLDAIASPEEVEWLREIYDRLFAERGHAQNGRLDLVGDRGEGSGSLPQIIEPSTYAPELLHGRYRADALAIARQLLGPGAVPRGEHAIFKPAGSGAETPWHQDEAYWDPGQEYDDLSIWIPLQPATIENGCLWFVPGSHRLDVLAHHPIGYDPSVHGLEVSDADVSEAVACPIPAGGCTVHHHRTLHYAGSNRSDVPRRAYALIFGTPPSPRSGGRHFPWRNAAPSGT